ncbi:MAG TPA: bifunctional serine/threonine-protein kinase/universal stress protein, partial [Myxococcales bacterium]|nr:bifunctional serine/threonine-protein kinase/universal stress protein [Myxococcales bacterium]
IARRTASERLMPGEMIDDFLVWEQVHAGAQGVVYRVTGPDGAPPLLMKVPRIESSDAAVSLLNYETEARILPVLKGPHVPRFFGAGDIKRLPYIVIEQIEGHSLEAELKRCPIPPDEVARIGAAIADALHELHRQQVVHCDLKPDNVIVKPDGQVVLIDFGLACHARFPDLIAEEQRSAGSAPYISPEQLLGVRGDARSDLFSLGVILYELATGELPFGIPASRGGERQRLWMDPDPPAVLAPEVSPALQEVILRCLEPEAPQRYQSAALLAFDLRHLAEVPLTERSSRKKPAGLVTQTKRWWKARLLKPSAVARALDTAPVIMVAVDTTHKDDERQPAIRRATEQVLSVSKEFRLVCVSVVKDSIEQGRSQVDHMVELREWTAPLGLPPERLSLHVMVAPDPAAALVEFARTNNASLIVLGAPRPSQEALAWWRSVASGVTANAPCSVHVVRVPEPRPASA